MTLEVRRAKLEELFWALDPLGVADQRAYVADEYRDGITSVLALWDRGEANSLADWWQKYLADLGLPPSEEGAARFAREVHGILRGGEGTRKSPVEGE